MLLHFLFSSLLFPLSSFRFSFLFFFIPLRTASFFSFRSRWMLEPVEHGCCTPVSISRSIECDALWSLACAGVRCVCAKFHSGASRPVKSRASLWPSFSTKLERCVKLYIGLMSCSIEYTGITLIQRVFGNFERCTNGYAVSATIGPRFRAFDRNSCVYSSSSIRYIDDAYSDHIVKVEKKMLRRWRRTGSGLLSLFCGLASSLRNRSIAYALSLYSTLVYAFSII